MSWEVEVRINGESILTIGDRMLTGKPEFSEAEADRIRDCAAQLTAFIGPKKPKLCACEKYAAVKGPYPNGFCPDCGCYFPSKGPEVVARAQERDD